MGVAGRCAAWHTAPTCCHVMRWSYHSVSHVGTPSRASAPFHLWPLFNTPVPPPPRASSPCLCRFDLVPGVQEVGIDSSWREELYPQDSDNWDAASLDHLVRDPRTPVWRDAISRVMARYIVHANGSFVLWCPEAPAGEAADCFSCWLGCCAASWLGCWRVAADVQSNPCAACFFFLRRQPPSPPGGTSDFEA